ncbi:MAG: Uncharacterized protein G01um101472_329 [Parcubacteria group bacterium Gr01-1014_72]|nr:MAG: Uncharacterized protein G01um101472_329 [Parcubacteria group bacterium Gr01-1014_72]
MRFSLILRLIALIVVVAGAVWLGQFAGEHEVLRELVAEFGYVGVFVIAVISGFNLAVPVPAAAFVPLMLAGGLSLPIVIAVIVFGVTLSDYLAYAVGKGGRHLVLTASEKALSHELVSLHRHHPRMVLFLLFLFAAVAPVPNEIAVIPLALVGYRFGEIVFPLLLGNAVFNVGFTIFLLELF